MVWRGGEGRGAEERGNGIEGRGKVWRRGKRCGGEHRGEV